MAVPPVIQPLGWHGEKSSPTLSLPSPSHPTPGTPEAEMSPDLVPSASLSHHGGHPPLSLRFQEKSSLLSTLHLAPTLKGLRRIHSPQKGTNLQAPSDQHTETLRTLFLQLSHRSDPRQNKVLNKRKALLSLSEPPPLGNPGTWSLKSSMKARPPLWCGCGLHARGSAISVAVLGSRGTLQRRASLRSLESCPAACCQVKTSHQKPNQSMC